MPKLLHVRSESTKQTIADLSIRFARDAVRFFDDVDEDDLRLQIANALLKSTMLPAIKDKFFSHGDGSLVSKLFADGRKIPNTEDPAWDLI